MTAVAKGNEPSMEEILASIRRIIADDHQAALATKPEPEPAAPAAAEAEPAPQPEPEPEPILDLAVEATPEPEPQGQDDIDLLFAESEPEPPPPPPPAPPPPPPPPVAMEPAPMLQAARPQPDGALLSDAASTSIAGAFSSLSNTLLTGNARTLEDLVKDMMKPMLKAWLDDNLPIIVERLVKAEIERVARGGR
jgi:cell pole-organizing protein PopZ